MSGEYRVLDCGGSIIASCRLQSRDPDFWPDADAEGSRYLHRLVVARAHAGQGLALRLIDAAASEALQAGCKWLRLDCAADRQPLHRLYACAGFTLRDERTCLRWHVARFELALPSN
ncbi:GNAT family N-acetyltransferase [Niveibacterium sp.]|uniref:GNAT family N-acetyltransferase n=1 Tax=Niveibacterium sp. TaxID=2017444 RepID=UPI0035B13A14